MKLCTAGFIVLLSGLILSSGAFAECRSTTGTLGGYRTHIIENDLVRVTVLPGIGGRIIEYTLKSSGHNQLYCDVQKLAAVEPGEEVSASVLYEAPGYEDTLTKEGGWNWPGDFRAEPYALEVLADTPEQVTLKLTAAKGSVQVERTHTLRKNSVALSNELTVTNTSSEPIEMMLRHKVAIRAGGEGRTSDLIAYPSQSGIVRKKFFPDNIWLDFLLTDGWISASDPVARETFLLTSPLDNLSSGGVWFDQASYYNLEVFGKKQKVAAGQSATLRTQWYIFSDVPLITFATPDFLGFFEAVGGEDQQFTLNTGIIGLSEIQTLGINGFFYHGPNRIEGFDLDIEPQLLSPKTSSITKKMFSPVDEIRARFHVDDRAEVALNVPLIDTRPPPPVVLAPLTDQSFRYLLQEDQNYQLWMESTAGTVRPDEVFQEDHPPRNTIEIQLLPNEYEGFQLAIRPKQGAIAAIKPVFEDLKEIKSGATFPAGSFGFYRGETIPVKEGPLYDPLVPNAAVTARRGQNAMLFVELYCDPMQLAGTYAGNIRLEAVGAEFRPIPIQVQVRPYQMPHARSIDTAFWVWKTWNVPGCNNTQTWPLLARYRLSPGWLRANPFGVAEEAEILDATGKAKPGKVASWNDGAKQWYLEALHQNNINRICPGWNIWGYADTWEWKHALVRNTRSAAGWLDRNGFLRHCYYQIVDEPLASRFAQLKQVIKLYRQANPDYQIMCTVAINPDLYGYIDMWHVPWGALDPQVARERQELGEEVWLYNARPAITGIGKLPRLIGWYCWKYRLDGYMHYAVDYTDSETTDNPWNSTGTHWATFFYPRQKTWDPELGYWGNSAQWDWEIPSLRLMQIRDGFEDYEYMKMLEKWLLLAKRHGRHEQNAELIDRAEKLLNIQDHFVGDFVSFTERPEDLMEARRLVGDMIEKLRRELTGEPY